MKNLLTITTKQTVFKMGLFSSGGLEYSFEHFMKKYLTYAILYKKHG
jgi:hypothetical protein